LEVGAALLSSAIAKPNTSRRTSSKYVVQKKKKKKRRRRRRRRSGGGVGGVAMKNGMLECKVCGAKDSVTRPVSVAYDRQHSKKTHGLRVRNVLLVVADCLLIGAQVTTKHSAEPMIQCRRTPEPQREGERDGDMHTYIHTHREGGVWGIWRNDKILRL
jgi:hypothetical protein